MRKLKDTGWLMTDWLTPRNSWRLGWKLETEICKSELGRSILIPAVRDPASVYLV